MEDLVRLRMKRTKLKMVILTTLAVTVAGALNAPMLVRGVMRELKKPKSKQRASENAVYVARKKLSRLGLIECKEGFWRITDDGKRQLNAWTTSSELAKPKKWDKKWRILIFDISEKRKHLRNKLRNTLISLGFKRLQDSVWVIPYDCEDFVALLKADFRIGKELLYIIADSVENDAVLRREFSLE